MLVEVSIDHADEWDPEEIARVEHIPEVVKRIASQITHAARHDFLLEADGERFLQLDMIDDDELARMYALPHDDFVREYYRWCFEPRKSNGSEGAPA